MVFLPAFLQVLRQVLLLHLLDYVAHFDGVVGDGVLIGLFLLHDLKHGILVQQLEIFTSLVGYFLLEDVLEGFLSRLGCFLTGKVFLVGLLLLDLVAPIIHPLHSIEVGTRDESCFHLDPFEFIVMLLFQQFLGTFSLLLVDLLLLLLNLPHLLDILHRPRVPYFLVEVVQTHTLRLF